ncbi:HAD-IIIC family phosphatase [Streptomyces sp. RKAG293]|uniref:HAD-IIIC family phosphatase n=1 Tax=Streptomyces sp. RKAG293 TaxID=2893403 RepID=UPI00203355BB|nr:HAD-IIIC family phosphatase [Streptomyces sp. RKAG293]MCM2421603.1 HAD-IIIC family phosphatase [Streptomyces sp. RKAG293]
MTTGLERLRELKALGRLEAEYDRVAPLLAELTDDPGTSAAADLPRAGRLLAGLDRAAVLAAHPGTPVVTVAVTGQSTVAQLVDPLTAELARHGLLLRPVLGDHGAYLHDLTSEQGLFHGLEADLSLCLLDAETVFSEVPLPWDVAALSRAADDVLERLTGLAAEHARLAGTADGTGGTLVLNTLPLLRRHTHQLVDHRSRAQLGVVWREFNAALLRLTERFPGLAVIDLDPLIAETGPVSDPRLAGYAKAQYTAPLLAAYAREAAHLARSLRGMTKKCLVLDLDDTLWDGILGDAGADGIAAAGTLRGEAFGAFQRTVKQLGSQGVLLAVSSKNDAEPVLAVLRDHPDMVLRETDFVQVNANWQPKDGNVADIADRLGIGLDSLVLADDSPAERAQVRHGAPQVSVVPLDDEPALHVTRLLADGWFDTPRLTDEDRARTGQYRVERERRELREGSGSHADFLRELKVGVQLSAPLPHEFARLAQLTQRTNQFNLTGLRLAQADLEARAADPRQLVLAARATDRFGDNGLVGAVLGHRAADGLHLDNIWLSCRVLARGIEQGCVAVLLERARDAGLTAVHARYRPTAKNHRVRDFYPSLGFEEVFEELGEDGNGGGVLLRHDLRTVPPVPDHLTIDARLERLDEHDPNDGHDGPGGDRR